MNEMNGVKRKEMSTGKKKEVEPYRIVGVDKPILVLSAYWTHQFAGGSDSQEGWNISHGSVLA